MTDQEKIDALYDWFWTNGMYYQSSYEHIQADWTWPDGWVDDFAVSMLDNWGGNCYRYASLSGMMFREATGLPVTVYHGIQVVNGSTFHHGWVTIEQKGKLYLYDVELDKFAGSPTSHCYKSLYEGCTLKEYTKGVGTNLYYI